MKLISKSLLRKRIPPALRQYQQNTNELQNYNRHLLVIEKLADPRMKHELFALCLQHAQWSFHTRCKCSLPRADTYLDN